MENKYDEHGFKGGEEDVGRPASLHNEYNLAQGHNQLERGLKSRHIQFLALGMLILSVSPLRSLELTSRQAVRSGRVSSLDRVASSVIRAPRLSSWPTSP